MGDELYFRPKARLLLQLGDQLIRNEAVALFELAKNAYDAEASYVKITFTDIDNPDKGCIIIEDDGNGMDKDIVENAWMQPGTDYKEKLFKERVISKKGRLPIGEKGIGRFGVYKLGSQIELVSCRVSEAGIKSDEVYLSIDWDVLAGSDYLDKIGVSVVERKPKCFTGEKGGTRIIIRNLKTNWKKSDFRETYRLLKTLSTPPFIPSKYKFDVKIIENMGWSKDLITEEKVGGYELYKGEFELRGDQILSFKYKFTPWSTMKELEPRAYSKENIRMAIDERDENTGQKDWKSIDLGKYKIGTVKIVIHTFSLDSGVLKLGVKDITGFKEYLKQNGGMRVYRDGMRVYDYGEKTNDWLDLNLRRVNSPGKVLSRNLFIGYVLLDREQSEDLQEKANREGFIENEAYKTFQSAVLFALDRFITQRNIDKDRIANYYLKNQRPEPVISRLGELKSKIETNVINYELRKELLTDVVRIESEYTDMIDTFLKSANAGINLGTIIHEADKIILELEKIIKQTSESDRAKRLVRRLSEIVRGYSVLLRSKDKSEFYLSELIQEALFNVEFRLEAHNIEVVTDISTLEEPQIVCAKGLAVGSILNIIDNSIWWLGYSRTPKKKIYITLSEVRRGYLTIILADNGPGFDLPEEERIKPFVSTKPSGMGLGLYIVNECMNAQGGDLLFPDPYEYELPKEFCSGAVAALSFKKGMIK